MNAVERVRKIRTLVKRWQEANGDGLYFPDAYLIDGIVRVLESK